MKSPLLRLLQGAGFSCGALVVGIAFGLFLTPYMLTRLGDEAYGVYALASLFAGWCGLLDFGLTTTASRYVTRHFTKGDRAGVDETGSTAIVLFGGISALVFLVAVGAFALAKLFGDRFDSTGLLGGALFFAGASFAVSKISDGVCGVIKGALRQDLTGGTVLIFRVLFGLANFAILYFGGRVIALFVGNFVLTTIQLLVWIFLVRKAVPTFRFSFANFRKSRVRTLFNYGFFAFLAQVGELAVNRSDLILIAILLSMKDVARYNLVVVTLASYFNSFLYELSGWETNWFARLGAMETTEEDEPGLARGNRRLSDAFYASRDAIARASILVSLFGGFGLVALGAPFIERWIGAEYLTAFPALALWGVAAGIYRGSAETNARLLQGLARHRVLALGAILHGVANVVLSVVFVKAGLGLFGIALGTVLPGLAIHYVWLPNVVCRLVGERRRDYWRRQMKTTLVGALGLVAPGLLVWRLAAPEYWRLVLLTLACAALYGAVAFGLGATKEERARVVSYLREKIRGTGN
ncbi:MAG: oligosaccharide flippase family protein [Thermoguttaceae bacterium]|nr:oligosaccharide flippase family protein [Thermoguttaceae bacterium]